jgi:hypothetical protein
MYTADGWLVNVGPNQATTVFQASPGPVLGSRSTCVVQRNNGQTGAGFSSFEFPLDTDEIALARGSIVTLSFTAWAGANWSPTSGILSVALYVGSGTPAKRVLGAYTNELKLIDAIAPLTATQTRYTFTSTAVVPGTGAQAAQASVFFSWSSVGTAGASDSFAIDDVQLEIGTQATPFERRPFEQELLACQRHYFKTFPYGTAPASNIGDTAAYFVSQIVGASAGMWCAPGVRYPRAMRVNPTVTLYNPAAPNAQARNLTFAVDCSGTTLGAGNDATALMSVTTPASGGVGNLLAVHVTADAGI